MDSDGQLGRLLQFTWAYDRNWPMAVLDPEPKYTTDGYQVVQSNVGAIGFPRGVKERTFTAALAP